MRLGHALALFAFSAAFLPAQPSRLAGPIDFGRTVPLAGHVHRFAEPAFDRGAVGAAFPLDNLSLVLSPSAAQQADLDRFLGALQDPASPDYQHWLTPEQFGDRFGLSQADYDRVVSWLEGQGFTVHSLAPSRNWIAFGGNAGMVEQTFHTSIHRYQVNGETHFANSSDPAIPAALAGVLTSIRGLNDFLMRPPHPTYTSTSGNHYLAPGDLATIYDLTSLFNSGFTGTGQKIVIAGQTAIAVTDIQQFRNLFGLPASTPTLTLVPGSRNPGTTGDLIEADLDLEWAGAAAPGAQLNYVYSTDVVTSVQYAVTQNLAPVISFSYGGCETASDAAALEPIAQQANAEGITWLASSGDSGAAGCESETATVAVNGPSVSLPASLPEVTAVGGTRFNEGSGTYWSKTNGSTDSSALSYIPEMAWNDSGSTGLAATGGGKSAVFAKPSWQVGTGVPADGARDIPDVSMTASANHDGAILCTAGSCNSGVGSQIVGGTSLSAPVFAGITALVNQYRVGTGAQTTAGLGNINPALYALAQSSTDAFHDVTTGNNIVSCKVGTTGCTTGSFGYSAGVGYDLATGLGSVDAYKLVTEWKGGTSTPPATAALSSVSVSPSSVTSGGSATVTVLLTAAAPAGGAVVTLTSSSSAFTVPASITVAAGQASGSGTAHAGTVAASTAATVTAIYSGVSKTASVTVTPQSTSSATLTGVSVSPSTVASGASATVTVTLSAAAGTGGASVSLSSSSSAFPASGTITVPAGQISASTSVSAGTVTSSTSATVTASYAGVSKTAGVTVTAAAGSGVTLSSVSVSPATVASGGTVSVTLSLSGGAPAGGATVTLSSTSSAFSLPASVTFPQGAVVGTLTAKAGTVSASTNVTISAAYQGTTKTATLTITPSGSTSSATLSSVTVSPSSLTGGSSATVTVTLTGAAPSGGATVSLSSNSSAFPVAASVTVPAGQTSGSVTVQTKAVSASTAVTVAAAYQSVTKTTTVTLTPAATPTATLTGVSISPSSVTSGSTASVTITLSAAAPTGGVTVSLSSNSAAFPVPSSVTVPRGQTQAAITVQTTTVSSNTPVTVTASSGGATRTASATLTAVVLPTLSSVTISPSTVTSGGAITLTIDLSSPAPAGGALMPISSSNPSVLALAQNVNMPAGYSTGYLRLSVGSVSTSTTVTVTVQYNGGTKTASVTVTPTTSRR